MLIKKNQSLGRIIWKNIRQSDRPMQTREAMKLLDQAKIPHTKSCGI